MVGMRPRRDSNEISRKRMRVEKGRTGEGAVETQVRGASQAMAVIDEADESSGAEQTTFLDPCPDVAQAGEIDGPPRRSNDDHDRSVRWRFLSDAGSDHETLLSLDSPRDVHRPAWRED